MSWRLALQLQVETWGYDPSDVIPRKAFLVGAEDRRAGDRRVRYGDCRRAAAEGGPESLVGFVSVAAGGEDGRANRGPYLHSHMLAVQGELSQPRPGGAAQAGAAKEALSARNSAHGVDLRSAGDQERFFEYPQAGRGGSHAIWWISMVYPHLDCRVGFRPIAWWRSGSWIRRGCGQFLKADPAAAFKIDERIEVPAAIYQWKASEAGRERALAVQLENRRRFQDAFSRGLAVLGFARDAEGNGIFELGPTCSSGSSSTDFSKERKTYENRCNYPARTAPAAGAAV